MDYKELLHKMMNECREDAERYLSGDKADYLYCKETYFYYYHFLFVD